MKNNIKRFNIITLMALIILGIAACAASPAVAGLISLDDAIDAAITQIEYRLPSGSRIVVAAISSPYDGAGHFIGDELSGRFTSLITLARDAALYMVETEQQFQMSGLVSDGTVVGIGQYLGANAVVTGELRRYAAFTQLRLRAVDVETSQAVVYLARIPNNDPILLNILPAAPTGRLARVSARALDHLNRGKDLWAQGIDDEAMREFNRAIALDNRLAEAYFYRAFLYDEAGSFDRAIADYTQAIRLDPNYMVAYNNRGSAYSDIGDFDRAIADYNQTIRLNPNLADAYHNRGLAYFNIGGFDRAIADYTQAIRLDPNNADAYMLRGEAYFEIGDSDRAIADYEEALRINPTYVYARDMINIIRQERERMTLCVK